MMAVVSPGNKTKHGTPGLIPPTARNLPSVYILTPQNRMHYRPSQGLLEAAVVITRVLQATQFGMMVPTLPLWLSFPPRKR